MVEAIMFLRSLEPCDIILCNRQHQVSALVLESKTRYVIPKLGTNSAPDFTVGRTCVAPQYHELKVTCVGDLSTVDGVACYPVELTQEEEVLINEVSCS